MAVQPLERRKYRVAMLDPAWAFRTHSRKGWGKSPQAHYDCMPLDEIAALPVAELMQDDAWLWIWATAPMFRHALHCVDSWGFTYSTQGVWEKTTKTGKVAFGTGFILRGSHEPFIIAKRGKPRVAKPIPSLFRAQRREHSRKPDEAYALAETLFGDGPRADLFARERRPGWEPWGNESTKFDGVAA